MSYTESRCNDGAMPSDTLRIGAFRIDARARQALLAALRQLLKAMLNSRLVVHCLIVFHLFWLTLRLAEPGDAFALDPRQYAYFIARGGEAAWVVVFGLGGLLGLLGLCIPWRVTRIAGAMCMGTVEFVIAHGLTTSRAAPTAEPTYGTLAVFCAWLILVHWLPAPPAGRRP